jgi:hypothetical protein
VSFSEWIPNGNWKTGKIGIPGLGVLWAIAKTMTQLSARRKSSGLYLLSPTVVLLDRSDSFQPLF